MKKIAVLGGEKVGYSLAKIITDEGNDINLIETNITVIEDLQENTDIEKISKIEKAGHNKNYSEKDVFEFYKKFQFNIDQFLNARDVYKSLSSIEGRALLYQRTLLTEEPNLKLELLKTLKNVFKKAGITNAFDLELRTLLRQISEADVPSTSTTY